MWVRSQDKCMLINITNGFGILEEGKNYNIHGDSNILSSYSTKERCIEILNELQTLLLDYGNDYIYTMPQE